jgi:anion-transporting  ArsA/GET3 family ATPase
MRTESVGKRKIKLPRTIFVTGKGGTGKSTIGLALALALARDQPTTLIEFDPRRAASSGPGPAFEATANGYIDCQTLAPRIELEAFIERIVPLRVIARRMIQSRTFGFVTAALPGLEAFLMLERLRLIAAAAEPDRFMVIDAPATGSALEMLSVAEGVKRVAPFGTLHRLAGGVEQFIRDGERFAVVLTSRAEDLAIREAIAAAKELRARGIRCAGAVLNCVTDAMFSASEIARLREVPAHQRLAEERSTAASAATRAHRELRRAGLEVVVTPMLYRATLARPELETLADALAASCGS